MTQFDERAVAAYWNRNAAQWTKQVRAQGDRVRELFLNPAFIDGFLPDVRGLRVVDLGCGEGYNTRLLAKRGASIIGVDISSNLITAARSLEISQPLGIRYEHCSFAVLDCISDCSIDVAVSMMALMDSPGLSEAMAATFRVLKPGGRLYFSVLHPCFWNHESHWLADEVGQVSGMVVSNYWCDKPYLEVGRFIFNADGNNGQFAIPRFPYRLETYLNALGGTGFVIERVQEPRPTPEVASREPSLLTPSYRHVPIALFVAARKP